MKYLLLIGDGMSGHKIESLGGLTTMEAAKTPNMDFLASKGTVGLYKSVPDNLPPGSDVANLSLLGYDPNEYYTGRSPLEAASMGVDLKQSELAFRTNLVSLKESGDTFIMDDYSAGHITTEDATELIKSLDEELSKEGVRFYPGVAYRHLMVWEHDSNEIKTTPPHDISDKEILGHTPTGPGSEKLDKLMALSREVFKDHPVNVRRRAEGKKTADSIWLWGQGRAPEMVTFKEKFGLTGSLISAVDLMKGIAVYSGLDVINVPGATGFLDTNFEGKADYAVESLKTRDFVCVHVEAPDEEGHQGHIDGKVKAIEEFDTRVVGRILEGLKGQDFRVIVTNDHPTPVELKTHVSESVPFVLYDSTNEVSGPARLNENTAKSTGLEVVKVEDFMSSLLNISKAIA